MTDDLVTRLRASRVVWENGGHRPTDDELEAAARIEQQAATIARLEGERDEAYAYAKHLAEAIFINGKFDAPHWEPLDDTLGLLTQIDNMVAGIRAIAAVKENKDA